MRSGRALFGLAISLCLWLGGCGMTMPYPDLQYFERMEPSKRDREYRRLLQTANVCLVERCKGTLDVSSRNELRSLKCHSLQLTVNQYDRVCGGDRPPERRVGQQQSRGNSGCAIAGHDISFLYDTLAILRCGWN